MTFREFLAASGGDRKKVLLEAILGGPVHSQLAAARQRAKEVDQRLRMALKAHHVRPTFDDLEARLARLEEGQEALLTAQLHVSRTVQLCAEILASTHEGGGQARGR